MLKVFIITLLICIQTSLTHSAQEPLIVKHYQSQNRYEFGLKILHLALSKLNTPYQITAPFSESINEARGESYVVDGTLDIQFMISTAEREQSMIPIRIPVYRGTLGARLLLIKPEKHTLFKFIKTRTQLQQFTGGHGAHWKDLNIYQHNQLPVSTNVEYQSLFKQLKTERFDYFHRGLYEIWGELANHKNDLIIADGVMLFYLQPTYFFVTKKRPELARKVERGLKLALQDGSYKTLFLSHLGKEIQQSKLSSRTLIILDNPNLPPNAEMIDMSWWLPEHMQTQIQRHYQAN